MPTVTPNIGLKKPLGNETVSRAAYNENLDILDQNAAKFSALAAHLADDIQHISYAVTTGAANTYAVTLEPAPTSYTEGMALAVKINADNTGASTINVNNLGAKSIKKPNGNEVSAGNLKTGSIYTMRYNGTNFILQGSDAAGNATPADVLSGKTFTNDQGDQTGSMPNKVGSATVITPGTADQAIAQGYYGGALGDGKVLGDADLIAANIKSGVSIFGVDGAFAPQGSQTFLSSNSFVVPENVYYIDLFMVGGGGSGVGNGGNQSGGGGGGHVSSFVAVPVTPGDTWTVTIGAGGGNTTFAKGGTSYTAHAGAAGTAIQSWGQGGNGGSGGGGGSNSNGGTGGSNGSNGQDGNLLTYTGGAGQLDTTRAWGNPAETLYAGGGGGGSQYAGQGGAGGAGGGGAGGGGTTGNGINGTANTGGGGGGKGITGTTYGIGGSGVLLIKWGY